ncbi:PASTA domain-containing protein [Stackebrandtia endophytica]|uniref:PASTA domain-containing protein n=1 Tax=Stackebrandtia endophytica TaxID=1496996 RepID=A0A543AWX8_9ACTN|nr:PASTA domain-containing protein [Stackebrandtia endophytica]TQL77074.1 PASTA domain-containing protein [Stackebrandtia endophytica]
MLDQPVPSTPVNRKPWFWIAIAGAVLALACCLGLATSAFKPDDTAAGDSGTASEARQEDSSPDGSDETVEESPEVAEIEMPSVVDMNAAVARDELERLGFTNVQFGSLDEEHNTIGVVNPANWTVIEQSHEPGRLVPADAVIVLGCMKN